jgi:hypothetical protein
MTKTPLLHHENNNACDKNKKKLQPQNIRKRRREMTRPSSLALTIPHVLMMFCTKP